MSEQRQRLAIVATHPIPYYVPLYRALARDGSLRVKAFFASYVGLRPTVDPGMGVSIVWKSNLLEGYDHEFLPGADKVVGSARFRDVDNPGTERALRRFQPDVVLIHGYSWKTAVRALLWCRRKKIPALMISDGSLHSGTRPLIAKVKMLLLPWVFRKFSAFLAIGDANERYLSEFKVQESQVFRVPMMLDELFWSSRNNSDATRAIARAELGLQESDFAALYVGKLIPRKRPRDLLEALSRLVSGPTANRKPIQVLFVGDGILRDELQRFASAESLPARFFGFVNIDDLPKYYCAADVLVHPAEIEAYGAIVLEAAVQKLPLILSDKVGAIGATSVARPGENTIVYPCGNVGALADQLQSLASDPGLAAAMSAASNRISEEHRGPASVLGTLAAVRYCSGSR